jgi:hypothetical protein
VKLTSIDGLRWVSESPISIPRQEARIRFAIELESEPAPESRMEILRAQLDRARRCAGVALDALRDDYEKGEDSSTFGYIENHREQSPELGLKQSVSDIAEFMEVINVWIHDDNDMKAVVDVTLKGDITNILLAVSFDVNGAVVDVAVES